MHRTSRGADGTESYRPRGCSPRAEPRLLRAHSTPHGARWARSWLAVAVDRETSRDHRPHQVREPRHEYLEHMDDHEGGEQQGGDEVNGARALVSAKQGTQARP